MTTARPLNENIRRVTYLKRKQQTFDARTDQCKRTVTSKTKQSLLHKQYGNPGIQDVLVGEILPWGQSRINYKTSHRRKTNGKENKFH